MKKHILFSAIFVVAISSKGQVGIGTSTPHSSAELDVTSANKGFLPPRMPAASRLAITSPATGLLVYQTDGVSGYYYFNGTSWQQLVPDGWTLSGNANTTSANFLGTTDASDLYLKTNGQLSARISPDNFAPLSLGYQAGLNNTGVFVTAIGYQAVSAGNTANYVTAVGYNALQNNNGINNTALGGLALKDNTTGEFNVAVGAWAQRQNTSGSYNVAIGEKALSQNVNGSGNTVVGQNAGHFITSGNNNTIIGYEADVNFTMPGANNMTAIGYGAIAPANNQVRIGNTAVTVIGGQVGWSTLSDERFKKDIREQDHGLDFIMQLKPITYHINVEKLNHFIYREKADSLFASSAARDGIARKESILYSGFSAQQVEQAAKQVGYDFNGVHKPANDIDHYALDYSAFVIPLVKGMQEQQSLIDAVNAKNEILLKEIEQLKQQIKELAQKINK